jgi:hypothetical protein
LSFAISIPITALLGLAVLALAYRRYRESTIIDASIEAMESSYTQFSGKLDELQGFLARRRNSDIDVPTPTRIRAGISRQEMKARFNSTQYERRGRRYTVLIGNKRYTVHIRNEQNRTPALNLIEQYWSKNTYENRSNTEHIHPRLDESFWEESEESESLESLDK